MGCKSPGNDWEPLLAQEWVMRLAVASKDAKTGKANPAAFELSSEDQKEESPRLSVWAESLTTEEEAWHLMGAKPQYCLSLRLQPEAVRKIIPTPIEPEIKPLDVVWYPLFVLDQEGGKSPDARPGAQGHAGISGLKCNESPNRAQRKSIRSQLADLAKLSPLPIEEWQRVSSESQ
jgi:hypothetical protein